MRPCSAVTGSLGLATSVLTDIAKTLPTAVFRSYPHPASQLGRLPFAKPPKPLAQGRLPYPYAPPNPMPPTKMLLIKIYVVLKNHSYQAILDQLNFHLRKNDSHTQYTHAVSTAYNAP